MLWDLRKSGGSGTAGSSSVKLLGAGGLFQHALLSSTDLVAPLATAQQGLLAVAGGPGAGDQGSSVLLLRPSLVQRVVAHPENTSLVALIMQVSDAADGPDHAGEVR